MPRRISLTNYSKLSQFAIKENMITSELNAGNTININREIAFFKKDGQLTSYYPAKLIHTFLTYYSTILNV